MTDVETPQATLCISKLSEISDRYDVILCDIWGVIHNGLKAFPEAVDALSAFRKQGGRVILITNAPRPSAPIHAQLLAFGVASEAFDEIVTSGDVTVGLIAERILEPVLHIGPTRDLSLLEAAAKEAGIQPRQVLLEEARYVLCTGLRDDEVETPESYDGELSALASRGLLMICANPDMIIHRGDKAIYCAGALAQRYQDLGGRLIYAGKPHRPIYARALQLAERSFGGPIDRRRVLTIGDGMKTDIAGAAASKLDALFITRGVHTVAIHGTTSRAEIDPDQLERLCAEYKLRPVAAMSALRN